jgi:hypothetical protein
VEIVWPEGGPEPKVGRRYSVQASQKAGEAQMVVVGRKELSGGWKATVRLDADPVRLLGKTSGYVSSAAGAMSHKRRTDEGDIEVEPEAVDANYQRLLSEEGRLKTALAGAAGRQREKVLASEEELAKKQRKRGKPPILAQAQVERRQKHLRRAA